MIDNEIIKALKDEVKSAEYVDSYYCNGVDLTLIKSAIDLINRQKAEIENLKDILYVVEDVNLVNYWYQQCEIAENCNRNFDKESEVEKQ